MFIIEYLRENMDTLKAAVTHTLNEIAMAQSSTVVGDFQKRIRKWFDVTQANMEYFVYIFCLNLLLFIWYYFWFIDKLFAVVPHLYSPNFLVTL